MSTRKAECRQPDVRTLFCPEILRDRSRCIVLWNLEAHTDLIPGLHFAWERMSVRKRNEYLEGDASDEDAGTGYDSEAVEESREALTGRSKKRRRVDTDLDTDASAGSNDGLEQEEQTTADQGPALSPHSEHDALDLRLEDESASTVQDDAAAPPSRSRRKTSKPKSVEAVDRAAKKSGVIYISRVPPFMKPQTLKHYLAPHAPKGLGRIFLTPEDHASHARRVKSGGNKKKSFTDGWVEFTSKRDAQVAVQLLNGNIIGGKKGNFYHDDLWNMKYLRGFKWGDLTEQIKNENAERAARMKEEVRRTKEENRRFVQDVERGKMLEGMEGKRKAKGLEVEAGGEADKGRRRKEFKQRKVRSAQDDGDKKAEEFLQRAGRKIF